MFSDPGEAGAMPRREVLKMGLGFSLVLGAGTALVGCSDAAKAPVAGHAFLRQADLELFSALAPAVASHLGSFEASQRKALIARVVRNVDDACAGLDLRARTEIRKLLDLLAIAPLRYVLTGVGQWNEAGVEAMQAFLTRWRTSRLAMLNAGGNVLVRLTSSSFYVLPESWPSTGYPGPLESVFKAVNS